MVRCLSIRFIYRSSAVKFLSSADSGRPRIFSAVGTPMISSGVIRVQFFLSSRSLCHCMACCGEIGAGGGDPGRMSNDALGCGTNREDGGLRPSGSMVSCVRMGLSFAAGSSAGLEKSMDCCPEADRLASAATKIHSQILAFEGRKSIFSHVGYWIGHRQSKMNSKKNAGSFAAGFATHPLPALLTLVFALAEPFIDLKT